jgi:tetratricopeptide (TPR) repeat protein
MSMLEDCLAALRLGLGFAEAGNVTTAPQVFDDVLREAAKMGGPVAREMEVVAHYGASRIAAALKREEERRRRLAEAARLARKLEAPSGDLESVDLVSDTLMAMGESQLAIPYCSQAVALTRSNAAAAGRLWRAGRCYVRAGFPREARAPLRDAVEALRKKKGDPRLPHALLDLGNACLQSDPAEAEPCYREAAEIWAAADSVNQAATAWLNLGVLCSRAERLDEALAWYDKVRAARAADPRATTAQRGNIHNNIASVWRKKSDFARARAEAERAIEILAPEGGAALAHALGTMGEIQLDAGRPEEALDWFRRAREEFERQPSPNVDQLATKLENEAAALERLGRAGEAALARQRIAGLRGLEAPVAPTLPTDVKAKAESEGDEEDSQAAVIVTLDGVGLADEIYAEFDLATLERRLEKRLQETGGGELDGHEFGPEATSLFLYGPDARALFDAIAPVLSDYPLCCGARIELRQGEETMEFVLGSTTLQ